MYRKLIRRKFKGTKKLPTALRLTKRNLKKNTVAITPLDR